MIGVVVNVHREGLLLTATLRSAATAIRAAQARGFSVRTVIVADVADELTLEVARQFSDQHEGVELIEVAFRDLGRARCAGVRALDSSWIAFLDGDDLWSEDWLWRAVRAASTDTRLIVWHPEVNYFFGARTHAFLHVDMDDPTYDVSGLALSNHWTALCFTSRDLLMDVPHPSTNIARQIGYEDWAWNINVIARGAIHKVVPRTAHGVRVKAVSLLRATNGADCIPPPCNAFRNILTARRARLST